MELRLTQSQEARLAELARHEGKNVGELLLETANRLLSSDDQRWADVDHALAQADRGEVLEEEQMHARLATMLGK